MKAYPQVVYDQLTGKHLYFGIEMDEDGGKYKQKALDYIDEHQEWRGGERLEYINHEAELNFVWKMTPEGFNKIRTHAREDDIFGNVYVGTIMFEFTCAGDGLDPDNDQPINDMYVWGMEDPEYDYWMNNTPYKFFDDVFINMPKRRSQERFQMEFEKNVIDMLNKQHPELIEEALKKTVINEWN